MRGSRSNSSERAIVLAERLASLQQAVRQRWWPANLETEAMFDIDLFLRKNDERVRRAIASAVNEFQTKGGDEGASARVIVMILGEDRTGNEDIAGSSAFTTLVGDFVKE
jgi:hypothetical protein